MFGFKNSEKLVKCNHDSDRIHALENKVASISAEMLEVTTSLSTLRRRILRRLEVVNREDQEEPKKEMDEVANPFLVK